MNLILLISINTKNYKVTHFNYMSIEGRLQEVTIE
ncbi:hypothetical protein JOC54_001604 [Alkalihalobacillus xiaoxiensis]|uniref:Uncharacterized protein n=1 Tax=Shouchella xiaoxiensis TaxID=766895 RepID=A0ABS2SS45_9BACI|nr:hypothetical protein [Shouchella xiaoxiensis]